MKKYVISFTELVDGVIAHAGCFEYADKDKAFAARRMMTDYKEKRDVLKAMTAYPNFFDASVTEDEDDTPCLCVIRDWNGKDYNIYTWTVWGVDFGNPNADKAKVGRKWSVVGRNTAVDEYSSVRVFDTKAEARAYVERDIVKCTTEPFTKQGHPLWSAEDIDRADRDRIKAADEFEWVILPVKGHSLD